MNRINFSLEIFGDRLPITGVYANDSTNTRQLSAMKKALNDAINSELTDRQKQMVTEFYFEGASVTQLAEKYGLSKSTVSRHLSRSRERLKGALRYGMYTMWSNESL